MEGEDGEGNGRGEERRAGGTGRERGRDGGGDGGERREGRGEV